MGRTMTQYVQCLGIFLGDQPNAGIGVDRRAQINQLLVQFHGHTISRKVF